MGIVDNWLRKKNAAAFLDDQVATCQMKMVQLEAIFSALTLSATLTGNLRKAYEFYSNKEVPPEEFNRWLDSDPQGKWWKAVWVVVRKGRLDSPYPS